MDIRKVLVTGAGGRIGRVVVKDLREHGYEVTPVDRQSHSNWWMKIIDCEDFGQVVSMMSGHDAVVHLAAIPHPLSNPADVVFRNNIMSAFNILEAAVVLGVKHLVMASSISALGTSFMHRHFNPLCLPIDESHPLLSQDAYGLSKMAGEALAEGFARRIPDLSIASLRFSLVVDENDRGHFGRPELNREYVEEMFAGNFWTYVDVRDAALACRLALEAKRGGHEAYYINAPDIILQVPVEDLLAKHYASDFPIADHIRGSVSPVDASKSERLLGWRARYDFLGNELAVCREVE
jgi:nucleoside-diphosphate-sugar epimerase